MSVSSDKHPLWAMGFRPFFLFGVGYLILILIFWIATLQGWSSFFGVTLHGHEMVLGFFPAILAGFLLTATQHWTGRRGVHGRPLQILLGFWVLGRLAFLSSVYFGNAWLGILDLLFLPLLLWYLKPYLFRSDQRAAWIFGILVGLLFLSNGMYHLEEIGWAVGGQRRALILALHVFLVIISILAGRIMPFFSSQVVKPYNVRPWILLDAAGVIITLLYALVCFLIPYGFLQGWVAFLAGIIHLIRFFRWQPHRSYQAPILWILFLGYASLVGGFFLSAGVYFFNFLPGLAFHAFTVGALGLYVVGMISRVTVAHTGRPITASGPTQIVFWLMVIALGFRVGLPLVRVDLMILGAVASAMLWLVAFSLWLIHFYQQLLTPRIDGQEG